MKMRIRNIFLYFILSISVISCYKSKNGKTNPVILLNNRSIDTSLYIQSLGIDLGSEYYFFVNQRNNYIRHDVFKRKINLLIELHFPDDIFLSTINKHILYISNNDVETTYNYMYLGKVQEKIYLKDYQYYNRIECPSISICDLTDSILYHWCPSKDDFPFHFHGNKISVYLNSNSTHPIYKQGIMSDEEQTIMNMQPDYIEELITNPNILYKDYMDSLHRVN